MNEWRGGTLSALLNTEVTWNFVFKWIENNYGYHYPIDGQIYEEHVDWTAALLK